MTCRIGRIFSLADIDRNGEWIDGHWSFETHLDLGSGSIDDESLYCLPLLVRTQNPGDWPDSLEYTRVGLLKVSLDLKDVLPGELRWIAEHANSEPGPRDLVTVTIS